MIAQPPRRNVRLSFMGSHENDTRGEKLLRSFCRSPLFRNGCSTGMACSTGSFAHGDWKSLFSVLSSASYRRPRLMARLGTGRHSSFAYPPTMLPPRLARASSVPLGVKKPTLIDAARGSELVSVANVKVPNWFVGLKSLAFTWLNSAPTFTK